jgi:hypothetical protein
MPGPATAPDRDPGRAAGAVLGPAPSPAIRFLSRAAVPNAHRPRASSARKSQATAPVGSPQEGPPPDPRRWVSRPARGTRPRRWRRNPRHPDHGQAAHFRGPTFRTAKRCKPRDCGLREAAPIRQSIASNSRGSPFPLPSARRSRVIEGVTVPALRREPGERGLRRPAGRLGPGSSRSPWEDTPWPGRREPTGRQVPVVMPTGPRCARWERIGYGWQVGAV